MFSINIHSICTYIYIYIYVNNIIYFHFLLFYRRYTAVYKKPPVIEIFKKIAHEKYQLQLLLIFYKSRGMGGPDSDITSI